MDRLDNSIVLDAPSSCKKCEVGGFAVCVVLRPHPTTFGQAVSVVEPMRVPDGLKLPMKAWSFIDVSLSVFRVSMVM